MATEFKTIVAPTISELFQKQIQEMIFSHQLNPGDRLPTERELSESMNISKTVVHEGIRQLERDGFLTIVPRKGIYVANYSETGTINTLVALLRFNASRLDYQTARDLVDLRSATEGKAIRLLSENHTAEDLVLLHRDLADFAAAIGSEPEKTMSELTKLDYRFHFHICLLCKNTMIPLVMNSFYDVSLIVWEAWVRDAGTLKVLQGNEELLRLIELGKGDEALKEFEHGCSQFLDRVYNQKVELNPALFGER